MEDYKKKHEDLVDRIKAMANDQDQPYVIRKAIEEQFPEIVESDDERIRNELIEFVDINTISTDERHDRWIAWLEKQGEKGTNGNERENPN